MNWERIIVQAVLALFSSIVLTAIGAAALAVTLGYRPGEAELGIAAGAIAFAVFLALSIFGPGEAE
ncbi:MAG TPA: hypothetical protein EYH32_10180 [Anaerolineae bacterium]|nr:hypothetical protein [Anaerolineae bacterium]